MCIDRRGAHTHYIKAEEHTDRSADHVSLRAFRAMDIVPPYQRSLSGADE